MVTGVVPTDGPQRRVSLPARWTLVVGGTWRTGGVEVVNRYHNWYCRSARWRRRLEQDVLPWVIGDAALGDDALEVGPGPGLTTDLLRVHARRLTCIEVDSRLAGMLEERMAGTNVGVILGDATNMPFEDARFSSAVSFTMLHHVPSVALQDRLFREICRVLAPGALFMGSDSTASLRFRVNHFRDVGIAIDPATLSDRLTKAGFVEPRVSEAGHAFRFRACRP